MEHALRVMREYLLLVAFVYVQPPPQCQCFGVFRHWVVGSEEDLLGAAGIVDGFADLPSKPPSILLGVCASRGQSGDVCVDVRVLVDELGNIHKPWVAKVAEDYRQLLPLVGQPVQRQRVGAGEVAIAERRVPGVEENRELRRLSVMVEPVINRALRRRLHVAESDLEGLHLPPVLLTELDGSLHFFRGGLYRYYGCKHPAAPPA